MVFCLFLAVLVSGCLNNTKTISYKNYSYDCEIEKPQNIEISLYPIEKDSSVHVSITNNRKEPVYIASVEFQLRYIFTKNPHLGYSESDFYKWIQSGENITFDLFLEKEDNNPPIIHKINIITREL